MHQITQFKYYESMRECVGLYCPFFSFYVEKWNGFAHIPLHVFDHELQNAISQLSLLFERKPMSLKLTFIEIQYDGDIMSITYNPRKTSNLTTITFQYVHAIYDRMVRKWYNYLRNRPVNEVVEPHYLTETVVRRNGHAISKSKYIYTITDDVILSYAEEKRSGGFYALKNWHLVLHVGIPSIENWHAEYYIAMPGKKDIPAVLVNLALLLQQKPAVIKMKRTTITYSDNKICFTRQLEADPEIHEFTYAPKHYEQIFEWWFTGLCRAVLRTGMCKKWWLSTTQLKQKIMNAVEHNPEIDPATLFANL